MSLVRPMKRVILIAIFILSASVGNAFARRYSDAEMDAMFVSREKPYYPLAARQRGITGSAVFRLYIDEQGRVTKIGVLASTGSKEMDASVMHAMVHWRTKPGPKREVDAPVTFTTTR